MSRRGSEGARAGRPRSRTSIKRALRKTQVYEDGAELTRGRRRGASEEGRRDEGIRDRQEGSWEGHRGPGPTAAQ